MRLSARLLALLSLALAGCDDPTASRSEPVDLRGTIVEVGDRSDGVVLLVADIETPSRYDDILLVVRTGRSGVPVSLGVASRPGDGSLLRAGMRIEAWTTGVELRSDPPIWTATRVVIIGDGG